MREIHIISTGVSLYKLAESGKDYRVRITNKGKLVLEEIKGGGR